MKEVIIMRGLPGTGKSTLARLRYKSATTAVVSTDNFPGLYSTGDDGSVQIDFSKLAAAHDWCFSSFLSFLKIGSARVGDSCIIVDNTNLTLAEMSPYRMLARHFGYDVRIVRMDDALYTDEELSERNTHGAPAEKIGMMRAMTEALPPFWETEEVIKRS